MSELKSVAELRKEFLDRLVKERVDKLKKSFESEDKRLSLSQEDYLKNRILHFLSIEVDKITRFCEFAADNTMKEKGLTEECLKNKYSKDILSCKKDGLEQTLREIEKMIEKELNTYKNIRDVVVEKAMRRFFKNHTK